MRKKILIIGFLFSTFFYVSSFAQTTLTVRDGIPVLDGIISPGEWTSTPIVTAEGVTLNAMADGDFLYLSASWADNTGSESIEKKQWTYDGASWTQSGNEDRIAFIFDMGLTGTNGANCMIMCHVATNEMKTNTGKVDTWHWKAARGNALGFVDDKIWDTTGRHSDPGTSAYSDNKADSLGFPNFMAAGDPGANVDFLTKDEAAQTAFDPFGTQSGKLHAIAVAFDTNAVFAAGNVIPGYVLRNPAGDRASVESAGTYENGVWTVEFKKPYAGGDNDFAVVPGSSVDFTHDIFDNQGANHAMDGSFDPAVYTLDFSLLPRNSEITLVATTGTPTLDGDVSAGEWTSTPIVTAEGVTLNAMADGDYLYLSASWADKTGAESIEKKQWTYDGASWTQSGNEDRIAFIWNMGLNGAEGANCATMCHVATNEMKTSTGKVDIWHWKAARGNALGFVDDKIWDTTGRHSDPGTSAYSDNKADASGFPTFMATGDPGADVDFLSKDDATQAAFDPFGTQTDKTSAIAVAFDAGAAFAAGNVIPGYVLRNPAGDRASVESAGKYENGVWTVEFRKPYTGGDNDFRVVPGSFVDFTHDIFDNQGADHAMDGSFDPTVYTLDLSNIPAPPLQTTLVATTGTPTLDGEVSPGEWSSTPIVTAEGVTLNSMADGDYLYLSASWADKTGAESIEKKQWTYDGASWSQSGNEDRLAFIWNMGLNGTEGANCATMCHVATNEMKTSTGKVDTWHWKAARGNALGFVDDKIWDTTGRHSDPGTSAYSDNKADASGFPTFMATGDPGADVDFLTKDEATQAAFDPFGTQTDKTSAVAVAFDAGATFAAGNVIPGYVLRNPAGDRASVESAGKYENGVWTVEFRKPYAGGDNDFEVVSGSAVDFTHDIFDNQGGDHAMDGSFDPIVYTLDLSNIPVASAVEEISFNKIPTDFSLNQNYPNPFNPSTTIVFSIPQNSFVNLKIFNMRGEQVAHLINEEKQPGIFRVEFDATEFSSGVYFVKLNAGDFVEVRKMIYMK